MPTTDYHDTVRDVYRQAAAAPAANLCCVPQSPQYLPGLNIPSIMHAMNYGCGSTVHPQDMKPNQTVAYVGVGGGLEALQLAYFTRRTAGVIAIDPVAEMRDTAKANLDLAAQQNDWFEPDFVRIVDGDALDLPLEDNSVDLAAQNCLFNIFKTGGDLEKALAEMHRILKPAGRLVMSDPVSPIDLPASLADDQVLRAQCISGCLTLDAYLAAIVAAGFGAIEVRSRKPYRMIDKASYPELTSDVMLETVEVAAFKTPIPADGACIFTGRTATYAGPDEQFDDNAGHLLVRGMPLPVCDKTANALANLNRNDITITPSTWHYGGGGCC